MPDTVKKGVPVIGVIFLALACFKFVQGEPWVVWFVLGFVFGGFGIFNLNRSKGDQA
jgi:hypothetical protein